MSIMSPSAEEPITLKEVQLKLGVPQHVLIHLCEKGVIVPDFAETSGRGKRREFSRRNLFEFGVALALRTFEVPVATTAFVVRLLRSFERATAKVVEGFELLAFVSETGGDIELNLFDGHTLVFGARGGGLAEPAPRRRVQTPGRAGGGAGGQRIYRDFISGKAITKIAKQLHHDRVPTKVKLRGRWNASTSSGA